VMRAFESFTAHDGLNGLLPEEQLPAFLKKVTQGSAMDGSYGMMWKAQMIMLLSEVGVCGTMDMTWKHERKTKDKDKSEQTMLQEYAGYEWPKWLDKVWQNLTESKSKDRHGLFISKSHIQQFINEVAFIPSEKDPAVVKDKANKEFEQVDDDDYDNWASSRQPINLWVKRGKKLYRVRGIWYECFAAVLDKMENGIAKKTGLSLVFPESSQIPAETPRPAERDWM